MSFFITGLSVFFQCCKLSCSMQGFTSGSTAHIYYDISFFKTCNFTYKHRANVLNHPVTFFITWQILDIICVCQLICIWKKFMLLYSKIVSGFLYHRVCKSFHFLLGQSLVHPDGYRTRT